MNSSGQDGEAAEKPCMPVGTGGQRGINSLVLALNEAKNAERVTLTKETTEGKALVATVL